jgi:hypothetical protein
MSASMKPVPHVVVLRDDVTLQDLARALEYTGLTVSGTQDPCVFVIAPKPLAPPSNVVPFERPAFHRRQAD